MGTNIFGQKMAEHKHENDTNEKFVTKWHYYTTGNLQSDITILLPGATLEITLGYITLL